MDRLQEGFRLGSSRMDNRHPEDSQIWRNNYKIHWNNNEGMENITPSNAFKRRNFNTYFRHQNWDLPERQPVWTNLYSMPPTIILACNTNRNRLQDRPTNHITPTIHGRFSNYLPQITTNFKATSMSSKHSAMTFGMSKQQNHDRPWKNSSSSKRHNPKFRRKTKEFGEWIAISIPWIQWTKTIIKKNISSVLRRY